MNAHTVSLQLNSEREKTSLSFKLSLKKFHTFRNSRLLSRRPCILESLDEWYHLYYLDKESCSYYVLSSEGLRFTWFWRSAILWIMVKIFSMIRWGRGNRLNACFVKQLVALDLQLTGVNYSVSLKLEDLQPLFSHVQHKSVLCLSNLFLEISVKQ